MQAEMTEHLGYAKHDQAGYLIAFRFPSRTTPMPGTCIW
jgi:hypothetical protein